MKTLIVYELVPEETKFFLVDGDRSELNNCFVNSKRDEDFDKKIRAEVSEASTWGDSLAMPFVVTTPIDVIVHCGFLL